MIDEARRDHYAYADEELYAGDVNVAATVLGDSGEPVAAVNISVPRPQWTLARARAELGPLVTDAARAISRQT